MRCPQCAEVNQEGARFCSGCGQRLPVPAATDDDEWPQAKPGPRVMMATCHRCGETLPPDSYFSRGLNVAKLVALLPVNFILPILFFFLRRDRLVCGNCRKLLPAAAPMGLLPAMAGTGERGLTLVSSETALTLASPEAQQLEKASRNAKSRGVLMALFAMPLSLPVVAFVGSMGWTEMAFVGFPGALVIAGAVNAFRRSSRLQRRAREAESRHLRRKILGLARQHRGRLNVAQAAAGLGCDFKEAEQVLDGMVDGRHVDVEVTDEGRLVYVFPDLANG